MLEDKEVSKLEACIWDTCREYDREVLGKLLDMRRGLCMQRALVKANADPIDQRWKEAERLINLGLPEDLQDGGAFR